MGKWGLNRWVLPEEFNSVSFEVSFYLPLLKSPKGLWGEKGFSLIVNFARI